MQTTDPTLCLLVVIGVREDGTKELLAFEDGYRESTDSWAGVFRDLRRESSAARYTVCPERGHRVRGR